MTFLYKLWMLLIIEGYKSRTLFLVDLIENLTTPLADKWIMSNMFKRIVQWLNKFEKAYENHDHIFLVGGLAHYYRD